MRKLILAAGLAVLLSGCGDDGVHKAGSLIWCPNPDKNAGSIFA
ncbi:lipoprotein [Pantoea sp. LMR881]